MPQGVIYLDNHSTTRVDPRVVEAMLPYFTEQYGNAGSTSHAFGWEARDAVEAATATIAQSIGAKPKEIIFTSGATESNNLAIRGAAERTRRRGNHLVSVATEHRAVLDPLLRLSHHNFELTLLPVVQAGHPEAGRVDPQRVADAIRDDTLLVSVMLANNEIGAIHPLAEIAAICRQRGVLLHCDATQAVGKIPVDVASLPVDLMSFSAHKIYGPRGVGALYVRRQTPPVRLEPQIAGGGQQHGLRSGTLNVPGIVGFARALQLCIEEMPSEAVRQARLRDRLWDGMAAELGDLALNGPALSHPDWRLAGNLNASFGFVDGEALMLSMGTLAVSSGSACSSAEPEPSHVLRALGLSDDVVRSSLRFGLGRFNTEAEIDTAISEVTAAVKRLRKLSSLAR
ncbi:MAG: aminotransferase class V-fold PLP-dependent enzyme [Planctomycetia bacterium]|nr:aminotransferase class V-fold PLP-dependent enzyme [Planctomycetia bacterium]